MGQSTALRPAILALSLLAGLSYTFSSTLTVPFVALVIWKGSGVGMLALYAALAARSRDGWLLSVVMALHSCGDIVLDAAGYTAGALLFMIGHAVAIGLYARNRRPQLSRSQTLLALLLVPFSLLIAFAMTQDVGVGVYTIVVSAMAAMAWTSRFSRYSVGIGAIAFLVSDLLIFARMGPLAGVGQVSFSIWILYFSGQFMITVGVARALAKRRPVEI
ncbi:MAG: lysoplasmalogenase family protein [Sphingomonadaceae bacterium]